MGIYLNPGNDNFESAVSKEIYVDHSMMLQKINYIMEKINQYICVSRPRRFGKSTDANMLVAYYSKGCDSKAIFDTLTFSKTDAYEKHLNKHHVIALNMQDFMSVSNNVDEMIGYLTTRIYHELQLEFSDCDLSQGMHLNDFLSIIHQKTKSKFIFIIDEWDCVLRDRAKDKKEYERYLDYLRLIFKDKPYIQLVYMTGILPIKKYGTHSALNMFEEISFIDSAFLSEFTGFTDVEVKSLCQQYRMDYEMMRVWYDGYRLNNECSVYNPRSVTAAIIRKRFDNYWTQTESFEALRYYIDLNFDGLKEAIIKMLEGESVKIDTTAFQNDMTSFASKDDILTLLIHLGYLGYNHDTKEAYIPNKEITDNFISSIKHSNWNEVTKALINSQNLLEATWN